MSSIPQQLAATSCEVRFDPLTRQLHATDASIYQVEPLAVAFPKSPGETSAVIRAAADAGTPVTPRGAGTGLAGGALGDGLILELARYNRWIAGLDVERRTVRVGPGVVLDQLNAFLEPHGLMFGPDVATSSRATLGGMIANDSSGARAPLYGTTARHVRSLEAVLADGTVAVLGEDNDGDLAALGERLGTGLARYARAVSERMPNVLVKRWPGYGLTRYLANGRRLAQLLPASEGTLAAITAAELSLVPVPRHKALGLFFFDSVAAAMQATVAFLDLKPAAIEHIDRVLLDQTRHQHAFQAARAYLELDEKPCEAMLLVELYDDDAGALGQRLDDLASRDAGLRSKVTRDAREMALVWNLRKSGLSLLTGRKGPAKPIAGIEDVAVRPEQLPAYVEGLQDIMRWLGMEASYYGHAASGLLHVRPIVDLHLDGDIRRFRTLAEETSQLTKRFKGSFAAEHGVGIARTEFLEDHVGPELMDAMRCVKEAFDPAGVFNPGKVVPGANGHAWRIDTHLRQGAGQALQLPFDPVLAFASKDESFVGNLEQCNGCGGCRKDAPTMCPTYIATGEEIMSTRGRANAIRAVLEQRAGTNGDPLRASELSEALSNCLSCKACTSECPSNVNMALLKAELLHARHQRDGLTLRDRMVSNFEGMARLATLAPGLSNAVLRSRLARRVMDRWFGFTEHRPFPAFARQRFDRWFARRARPETPASRGAVYLWDDESVRFSEPHIGQAAVAVLEAAGYEVRLATGHKSAGRPAFSVGRLDMARQLGKHNVAWFRENTAREPIVFLEPSDYSMFTEDYCELKVDGAAEVAARCVLFEDFVYALLRNAPEAVPFAGGQPPVAIHAHCHTKALADPRVAEKLAGLVPGCDVTYLDTGCCGMAGQFGQLKEKYDLSVLVGRDLAEKVNALPPETRVVASGTSCRHQIEHLTGRRAWHLAEVLAAALRTD